MKRIFGLLCVLQFFTSCEKYDDFDDLPPDIVNPSDSRITTTRLNDLLTRPQGFRIAEFTEDGRNYTRLFADYVFSFRKNGTVTASKAGESITGSYLVFMDDGKTELKMQFPSVPDFYELTDDWYFISQQDTIFRFADGRDVLVLKKN